MLPHKTIVASAKHSMSGYWSLMVCDVDERFAAGGKILTLGVNDDIDHEVKPELVLRYRLLLNRHLDESIAANRAAGRLIWPD